MSASNLFRNTAMYSKPHLSPRSRDQISLARFTAAACCEKERARAAAVRAMRITVEGYLHAASTCSPADQPGAGVVAGLMQI